MDVVEGPIAATPILSPMGPVTRAERISSVDTLRGCALLGILLVNILDFGLPHLAGDDPTVAGGATGANLWIWAINYVLFEGKMRALFSMLFGAGVVIFTSRAETRGMSTGRAGIFYRRTLWLLFFGLLHAYLIWWGDILYFYAVAALFLYPFRRLSPKKLFTAGVIVLALQLPGAFIKANSLQTMRSNAAKAEAASEAGRQLTERQKKDKKVWAEKLMESKPDARHLQEDIDNLRGNYWRVLRTRVGTVSMIEGSYYFRIGFFDAAGMILIGMGLLKLGFFSAKRSYGEYALVALVGYLIAVPLNCYVVYHDLQSKFDPAAMAWSATPHELQRLAMALAHAALVMFIMKAGALKGLTSRLGAVGQMALTNYLLTSIVCTTIFYGYGFGLFGQLERYQLYYLVVSLWAFQLIASKIWLDHFRFGPMEWVWRSLTYLRRQPMRLEQPCRPLRLQCAPPAS